MGAFVDLTFVERIQGDIKAGCEKLEEYGYESLVIMVCKDSDVPYIAGSQKGTDFLEFRNPIIPEFTQFCVGQVFPAKTLREDKKLMSRKEDFVKAIFGTGIKTETDSLDTQAAPDEGDPEPVIDDSDETDDYDDTQIFPPLSDNIEVNGDGKRKRNEVKEKGSSPKMDKRKSLKKRRISKKEEQKEKTMPELKVVLTRLSEDRETKRPKERPKVSCLGSQKVPPVKQEGATENESKTENTSGKEGLKSVDYEEIDLVKNDDAVEIKVHMPETNTFGDPTEELECHFCLKVFSTNDALNIHINFKHEKNRKEIKCPHCGKLCDSTICLGDHLAKQHEGRPGTGKESYPCSQCKFVFSYKTHLVEHNQKNSKCKEMVELRKQSNEIKDNILESKISYKDKNTGEMCTKTVKELINTDKPNTCEICLKCFDRPYSFRRHIFQHSTAKHFQCTICLYEFNMEEGMKRHWKLHDAKPYYCCNCYERYETRTRLNYHTSISCKMIPEKPELKCPTCGQQTKSQSALETHKRSCAGQKDVTCETCGKQLTSMHSLRRHFETYHSDHTPFDCLECGRQYKRRDSLKKHMTIHGEKKFKCGLCQYATTDARNLQKHQQTHTGEKPFICDYCGAAYTRKPALDNHRRLHTGERPFKCDFEGCGKDFRNPEGLRQHQCYHSSTYAYVCDFCGRKFKVRGAYKHHRRYHTVEFRWPCEYCDEKFKTRMTYKTHIIKKHIEKVEETERKSKIKYYRCNICPKLFSTPEHLQEHNNVHMGIKPVKCRFCGKGFSSKGNMLQHEKQHTGGKKYRCSLCPKSYSLPDTFHEHLESKHGQKVDTGSLKALVDTGCLKALVDTGSRKALIDTGSQKAFEAEPDKINMVKDNTSGSNQKRDRKPEPARRSIPSLTPMELETYEAASLIPSVFPLIMGEAFKITPDY